MSKAAPLLLQRVRITFERFEFQGAGRVLFRLIAPLKQRCEGTPPLPPCLGCCPLLLRPCASESWHDSCSLSRSLSIIVNRHTPYLDISVYSRHLVSSSSLSSSSSFSFSSSSSSSFSSSSLLSSSSSSSLTSSSHRLASAWRSSGPWTTSCTTSGSASTVIQHTHAASS